MKVHNGDMEYTYYHHVHDDYQSATEALRYWLHQTVDDPKQILRAVSFDIDKDFDTKQLRYSVLVRGSPLEKAA